MRLLFRGGFYSRKYGMINKVNEFRCIGLFVVSGSIKMLFSIVCVNIYFSQSIVFANIYLFSIFFSIDFARWKSMGLHHIFIKVGLSPSKKKLFFFASMIALQK